MNFTSKPPMKSPMMRRRDLLLGLGAGSLLVGPFLRSRRAWGATGTPGTGNFLLYFTPNGHYRDTFRATGNDAGFTPTGSLKAAESMKSHFTYIRGLCNKSQQPSNPFHDQIPRLLSCVSGADKGRAYGPTIDHVIGKLTDTPPITTRVYIYADPEFFMKLSWRAAGELDTPYDSPMATYQAVFGKMAIMAGAANPAEVETAIKQERSVLDYLKEDIDLFRGRVPTAEKARLEGHLDAVRQMEKKLGETIKVGGACNPEMVKTASTTAKRSKEKVLPDFKRYGDLITDIMFTAFACGVRNSGTMMWQAPGGGSNPTGGTGQSGNHHHVSHSAPSDWRVQWNNIDEWYAREYAAALKKAQDIGILDQTAIVWASDIAQLHSHNDCCYVVGGGKALGIKHQKSLIFPYDSSGGGARASAQNPKNASLSDLWTSVLRACSANKVDKFGEHSTGGLPGLWAPV